MVLYFLILSNAQESILIKVVKILPISESKLPSVIYNSNIILTLNCQYSYDR